MKLQINALCYENMTIRTITNFFDVVFICT